MPIVSPKLSRPIESTHLLVPTFLKVPIATTSAEGRWHMETTTHGRVCVSMAWVRAHNTAASASFNATDGVHAGKGVATAAAAAAAAAVLCERLASLTWRVGDLKSCTRATLQEWC